MREASAPVPLGRSSQEAPPVSQDWRGRTVLVTGAGRGIGAQLSRRWLARGATVIAHAGHGVAEDRIRPLARDLAEETGVAGIPDRLRGFVADAATPGAMGKAFRRLLDREPNIDAVFFNHGTTTFEPDGESIRMGPPSSFDGPTMRDLVQINALSIWEALHELGRRWARPEVTAENSRRRRAIVLESSSGALNPNVFDPAPYKASKAMLLHFVRDLAPELARYRVSINAVSPGMIDAGLSHLPCVEAMRGQILEGIPMERYGDPEELFHTVDLFLSGRAAFATGNNVTVNGGAYVVSS
jgi:NAD(P)-dependent dehydrogenase (short-subunit alcohol dehydrogenase family)